MSKFEQYNVVLKDLKDEIRVFEYDLDEKKKKKIDSPEVQKGKLKAIVKVQKKISSFELTFSIEGTIFIPCDRCLDDMQQNISYKDKLQVKFGATFSEENDIVIVPEAEGTINIAWFLYEFIILNIPIKHVHAAGACNKTMVTKLKRHIAHPKDNEAGDFEAIDDDVFEIEDSQIDSQWDGLQNMIENN